MRTVDSIAPLSMRSLREAKTYQRTNQLRNTQGEKPQRTPANTSGGPLVVEETRKRLGKQHFTVRRSSDCAPWR